MPVETATFQLAVEGVDQDLEVLRFSGREAISELFEVRLEVASVDGSIPLANVVGAPATLTLKSGPTIRHINGIIGRFEQRAGGLRRTSYVATLVPEAWKLQHRRDCRIFQELTTGDILTQVLDGAGISDHRVSLEAAYAKRDYCVQYRESDWAFINRLMEEEGMFFFFEHGDDKHTLVVADARGAHEPVPGNSVIPLLPSSGMVTTGEMVSDFTFAEEIQPGGAELRDYRFQNPALRHSDVASASKFTDLAIYDYPAGQSRAQVVIDRHQARRAVGSARGPCMRLVPGHWFELSGHPRSDFNRGYVITSVEHDGVQNPMSDPSGGADADKYECKIECVPSDVVCRPLTKTRRPSVRGVQSAVVVGPSGAEIYTDEHARVKVQFQWDRLGSRNEKSSCWLRVSQVAAGAGFGAMHLPRIGEEVLVDFIDGDPDRPIVVGRVYDGTNRPPYSLPAEKTKSTLKSNTTTGGGGYNELTFDDIAGSELVLLRAQKDYAITTLNDKTQSVGHDETLDIGNDRTKSVGHDQSATVGNDDQLGVGNDQTITIAKNRNTQVGETEKLAVGTDRTVIVDGEQAISVKKSQTVAIGENNSVNIGKDATTKIEGKRALQIEGSSEVSIGAASKEHVLGARTSKVDKDSTTNIDGDDNLEVKMNRTVVVHGNLGWTVDGAVSSTLGSLNQQIGGLATTSCEKELSMHSEIMATLSAPDTQVSAESNVVIDAGEKITLKVGSTTLVITESEVIVTSGGATKKLSGGKVMLNC